MCVCVCGGGGHVSMYVCEGGGMHVSLWGWWGMCLSVGWGASVCVWGWGGQMSVGGGMCGGGGKCLWGPLMIVYMDLPVLNS